ncbi:hypothetical protein [Lentzea pudingi]|nr:hypothetical protein [Lentzea pudingi]
MDEGDWVGLYRNIGGPSGCWSWDEVGTTWRGRYAGSQELRSSIEIVDSVLASGVADRLLALTAMDDLAVASAQAPGRGTITVISPANFPVVPGHMGLSFYSEDGRREFRQYLAEDAVEAFWDVVGEKFGITRVRAGG